MNYKQVAAINSPLPTPTMPYNPNRGYSEPQKRLMGAIDKLKESRIDVELEKMGERANDYIITQSKPTLDTIVIDESFELDKSIWKCRDGTFRYLLGNGAPKYMETGTSRFIAWPCEGVHYLEIIEDLLRKIASLQKEQGVVTSQAQITIDTIEKQKEDERTKLRKNLAESALNLLK